MLVDLSYERAVCRETVDNFAPGFKSVWRMVSQGLLAAGFAYEAYRRSGIDVASDYAFKTAIGIAGTVAAFIVIHFAISWATAPRRVFYKLKREIADLKRLELNRERLRGLLNVLDEMQALRNDIARSEQGVIDWCAKRDALKSKVRDKISEISEVDARNFLLVTHVPPMSHHGCQSQAHSDMVTEVIMLIERLQTLIDRYSAALESQSRAVAIPT
jgi:hypothetical protein